MEEDFLFTQIKGSHPNRNFHPCDKYCLAWKAPNSSYMVNIALHDREQQEATFLQLETFSSKQREEVLFFFFPLESRLSLFGPLIHPASLVSYKTKTEVFNKLSQQYLEGLIGLDELDEVLTNGIDVWRRLLYQRLPADEQVYHEYLNIPFNPPLQVNEHNAADLYVEGNISFDIFHDLKFSERAKKREMDKLIYPRPPTDTKVCVVCEDDASMGVIKCTDCENKICVACVDRLFGSERDSTVGRNFLTLHRYYCMKRSKVPLIITEIAPPPTYLLELRMNGREEALRQLPPQVDFDENDRDDEKEAGERVESNPSDVDDGSSEEGADNNLLQEEIINETDVFLRQLIRLDRLDAWLKITLIKFSKLKKKVKKHRAAASDIKRSKAYTAREILSQMKYESRLPKYQNKLALAQRKLQSFGEDVKFRSQWLTVLEGVQAFEAGVAEICVSILHQK